MNFWTRSALPDDKAYREALARRASLIEELRLLEEFIGLYEKLFTKSGESGAATPFMAQHQRPKPTRQRGVVSPRAIARAAREVLVEAGRPMVRSELAEALEARGVPLAGVDKVKNLGTILWRQKDKFVHLDGYGYWPADMSFDPAGYHVNDRRF